MMPRSFLPALLIAALAAPASLAHAQHRPMGSGASWTAPAIPALPAPEPVEADSGEGRIETHAAQQLQEEASEQAAASAILDEGFWRQVLAGVIVTVVSTLILRAIL